ncbi:glycoside hydrolase family 113 [Streptomyces sp. NPDC048337]|uniref:glycoside hydrolase family 113 n=1 Tax=Streptomyces sp. NPDC048337 TaxID=3365535 RepID=UPI00371BFB8E
MKRSRIPLLAVFPVTVITGVIVAPLILGNHPVRWTAGSAMPHVVVGDAHAGPKPTVEAAGKDAKPPAGSGTGTGTQPPPAAPATVANPWKPGMPQWGVQIYWEDTPEQSASYLTEKAQLQAKYLIGLKANSVSISFPFYTGNVTSTKTTAGPRTPSPERLETVLKVFQEAGLRTTVRPLMDEKSLGGMPNWRGTIKPSDKDAWFASYTKFLGPYLDVAEKHKVASFTLATELNSLEGDPRWKALADTAEKSYSGEIGYDANYDNYVAGRINMPVEQLGVDAYFPVKVPDTAPVEDLVKGWNVWLDKKSRGPLPEIVISEAGIGAMTGAYQEPGDFHTKRALNTQVQANWYNAVCQVVKQRKMKGVYWWSIYFDDDPFAKPADSASRLHFAGRPDTEKAIRDCFGSDYALTGSTPTS